MHFSEISIVVEPAYMRTPWWEETRAGIDGELLRKGIKARYHFCETSNELKFDKNSVLILAGETYAWIDSILCYCECAGVRTVLACSDLGRTTARVSCVTLSRSEVMSKAVRYLHACGRSKICAFAMNQDSPADMRKLEGYIHAANHFGGFPRDTDIIKYTGSIEECFNAFMSAIQGFDAAICTNDLSAKYLITRLSECGVKVPEDIYVMSFGNTLIGRCSEPSITTVSLDLQELGRQAVKASLFLFDNPDVNSIYVTINCRIIARKSTADMLPEPSGALPENNSYYAGKSRSSYSDPVLNQLVCLEKCLASCDIIDARLIKGILAGTTYSQLAEELFIADGTLRYRIERIFREFRISSRKELVEIFSKYMPNFSPDMIAGKRI